MSSYKKKELMDYLTRKPVTAKDYQAAIDINALRPKAPMPVASIEQPETDYPTEVLPNMAVPPQNVLPKGAEPVMPSAPGIPNPQNKILELATGGRVNFNEGSKKEPPKIIPLNLESVAFKLFQDKLDNLSYNQKQTVYDYIEDNRNKKADGGRIQLQNGSDGYIGEIPSLGFSDPIDILEQRMINEKDPIKVEALNYLLENAKKEKAAKEMEREEFKKSQKEKGIKYKEDFPSEAAYFAETGKQLLTNPKYFLGKGLKGAVEGTEWLVGQPLQTLFSQEGKNFEFYQPVAGEKLGINKFIEKNIPKDATTGTLLAGDVAEIAGSVADPFLAYGLVKGAVKGAKAKPPTTAVDETIDPTRRDILKTGAVMGTGAALYPIGKKLGMFDELAKGAKVATRVLPKVKGMPEWFSPLVSKIEREGLDITSQAREARKKTYTPIKGVPEDKDFGIVQSKKIEIPVAGKEPEIITMTEYKNGDFSIESNISGGAFNFPFDIYYSTPKEVMQTKYVRDKEGNLVESQFKVKKEGDFRIEEQRPGFTYAGRYYDESPDVELDYTDVPFENSISDLERLEEIAMGKKPDPKKIKERKEYRDYVEKNPYDDALSRTPEPDPDYDYGSYIKDNE